MRICLIGDCHSVHVQSRVAPFLAHGHLINAITPRRGTLAGLVESVPNTRRFGDGWLSPFNEAAALLDHYRLIRDCQADVIHVHYAASLGAWLLMVAARPEPTIVSVMGGDILDEEQTPLPAPARWMTGQLLKRADIVTAKTDHMVGALKARGVPEDRILKLQWGVDTNIFRPVESRDMRRKLGLGVDHRIILSPRILRPFYSIHRIVEAMPAILDREKNARLVITEYEANPAYRTLLKNLAAGLGIQEAVIWAGEIPHARMPELYNLADVVVSIPPSDGFPQTILEALACGVPCVVSSLNQYKEVIRDGESAIFVDSGKTSISEAVFRIIGDKKAAEKLKKGGAIAMRQVADFKVEVQRLEKTFGDLNQMVHRAGKSNLVRLACAIILTGLVVRNALRLPSRPSPD